MTAGLRYEMVSSSDAPTHNPNFEARYGYSNSVNMDGTSIFLPRLGLTWEATEDIAPLGAFFSSRLRLAS